MQTKILKILIVILIPFTSWSQTANNQVNRADSLFKAKQFTQSYALYHSTLKEGNYSPAMLLKMAYIQDGLNHPALCLYYLNLYHKATDDYQAVTKMEDIATKNRLEGYQSSNTSQALLLIQKNADQIMLVLSTLVLLLFAVMIYQKRKKFSLLLSGILLFLFCCLLMAVTNWSSKPSLAIITQSSTYLMSGPSSGSSVIAIINEGHRVEVEGKKDVWLKIQWKDKDAFVKESCVIPVLL